MQKTKTYTLKNSNGIEITFIARGGQVISMKVPDAKGNVADVVLGYDTVDEALSGDAYFAAICGRFANRIAGGKFTLDGVSYNLDLNDGSTHLHGGNDGFNLREWAVEETQIEDAVSAYRLSLVSPDGDQNYPGELSVSVIYSLNDNNEFCIGYEAETTKPTVINLTSHPYFNLNGEGDINNHYMVLNCDQYTPIDPDLGTCGGEIAPVAGTVMDYTKAKKIAVASNSDFEQMPLGGGGLDHNFVVNGGGDGKVVKAATLTAPESGRVLEVFTDQPGIQVYTANHMDNTEVGKNQEKMPKQAGVAFETQIFPNSPNCEKYPNAVLRPDEKYKHTCIYKFSNL